MAQDYIPSPDADFNNWFINTFLPYVNTNFAALGLTMAQNTALQNLGTQWTADYNAHLNAQSSANAAAAAKDTTRGLAEDTLRPNVRTIQANTAVTNEQRAAMGITIPDTIKTPSPVPATRPGGTVDNRQRLMHITHYFDETTPNSKARPEGVRGIEFWLKIGGPPPVGPNEVAYAGSDTRSPFSWIFDAADAGKMAHWMMRWINTRGEPGPWSETLSFTITG